MNKEVKTSVQRKRVSTPLAVRNNNPLNIRFNARNSWIGQCGSNKGFCVFTDLSYGVRAAVILLQNYVKGGFNTIDKIIDRWAPASENNTIAYKRSVVKEVYCSFLGDTELDDDTLDSLLNVEVLDTSMMSAIILAMARVEIGASYLKSHPSLKNDIAFYAMSYLKPRKVKSQFIKD